ncbi:MAG: sulfite exporter TauE/SafE family protein [Phycisphaerales bacterium]|nr:sulfite exporter TauE/SafE family protein [Phycisphaerales bacterium]
MYRKAVGGGFFVDARAVHQHARSVAVSARRRAHRFLPCGLVYVALAKVAVHRPSPAGFAMIAFGLGTVPAMVAIGCGGTLLGVKFAPASSPARRLFRHPPRRRHHLPRNPLRKELLRQPASPYPTHEPHP